MYTCILPETRLHAFLPGRHGGISS